MKKLREEIARRKKDHSNPRIAVDFALRKHYPWLSSIPRRLGLPNGPRDFIYRPSLTAILLTDGFWAAFRTLICGKSEGYRHLKGIIRRNLLRQRY